jgi:hypothetical protein
VLRLQAAVKLPHVVRRESSNPHKLRSVQRRSDWQNSPQTAGPVEGSPYKHCKSPEHFRFR